MKKSDVKLSKSGPAINEDSFAPRSFEDFFDYHDKIEVANRGTFQIYKRGSKGITILTIHSIGLSGLSFTLLARCLDALIECQIISIDLRHHGNSYATSREFTLQSAAMDIHKVLLEIYPTEIPSIHLLSHLMGGCVSIELANTIKEISSVMLINCTEENCLSYLPKWKANAKKVPQSFPDVESAVLYYLQENHTTNPSAARVVVPGLLINTKTNMRCAEEFLTSSLAKFSITQTQKDTIKLLVKDNKIDQLPNKKFIGNYVWRVDIPSFENEWLNWCSNMSEKFLAFTGPKLLLLSEVMTLDKTLMACQMNKKCNLQCDILPRPGINIHESHPDEVATILAQFLVDQKFAKKRSNKQPK